MINGREMSFAVALAVRGRAATSKVGGSGSCRRQDYPLNLGYSCRFACSIMLLDNVLYIPYSYLSINASLTLSMTGLTSLTTLNGCQDNRLGAGLVIDSSILADTAASCTTKRNCGRDSLLVDYLSYLYGHSDRHFPLACHYVLALRYIKTHTVCPSPSTLR